MKMSVGKLDYRSYGTKTDQSEQSGNAYQGNDNLGGGRKRFVKGLIKTIAFVSAISGMLYIGVMLSYKSDVKTWNNGQHENCGQWEMFDVEKNRHGSTHYYYKCNECGKIIDLSTNFTK